MEWTNLMNWYRQGAAPLVIAVLVQSPTAMQDANVFGLIDTKMGCHTITTSLPRSQQMTSFVLLLVEHFLYD